MKIYIRDIKQGKLPLAGDERLTGKQELIEAIYLGLRQGDGISLDLFKNRFGKDFHRVFGNTLNRLSDEGLVHLTSEYCRLTREGMLFLDSVAARLVAVLE